MGNEQQIPLFCLVKGKIRFQFQFFLKEIHNILAVNMLEALCGVQMGKKFHGHGHKAGRGTRRVREIS